MPSARSKAESEAIRHNALARLAAARREKLTAADFDVYCDGLGKYDAELVRRVCAVLETEVPGEYQPRFPDLPFLVARCEAAAKFIREQTRPKPLQLTDGDKPLDPARLARFREDVQRSIEERHSIAARRR